jgi:hypothetical protein
MSDIYTNCTTGNEPKTFVFNGVQVEVDDPFQDQTEWVYNHARITHRSPQMIDRVVTAYRQRRLFNEFILCPDELEDLSKKLVAIDAREQMRAWLSGDRARSAKSPP